MSVLDTLWQRYTSMRLSLAQLWWILILALVAIVAAAAYNPAALAASVIKTLLFGAATAVIGHLMLLLAQAYASYLVERQQADAQTPLLADIHEPVLLEVLVASQRSTPGRKKDMVTIPTVAEAVHISDERVGALIATHRQAQEGDHEAQRLVKQWDIPEGTLKRWIARRRVLGHDDRSDAREREDRF